MGDCDDGRHDECNRVVILGNVPADAAEGSGNNGRPDDDEVVLVEDPEDEGTDDQVKYVEAIRQQQDFGSADLIIASCFRQDGDIG